MTKESDCLPCSGGFYCYKLGAINFDFSLNDTGTGQCAAGYYCKSGSYHSFSHLFYEIESELCNKMVRLLER